jgi:hypothetical protein
MKRHMCILLCMLGIFSFNESKSQVKYIKNAAGDTIAFENASGKIKSAYSYLVNEGTITQHQVLDTVNSYTIINGVVIADPTGAIIASYNTSTHELKDVDNKLVFKINGSNHVLNTADMDIGRVESDGSVFSNDNNKLGEGFGVNAFKLAYLFFYNNK